MEPYCERLKSLKVSDVMNHDVVQVRESDTMDRAAAALAQGRVRGLPVVDDRGRCVGIISAIDFVHRHLFFERGEAGNCGPPHRVVAESADKPIHISDRDNAFVGDNMTRGVQSVASDSPMLDAARIMCTQHVHRLPVCDDDGRVVGVVGTFDLVSAMIGAIDEKSPATV